MSPTYERWKYCGATLPDGTTCGKIAEYECDCSGPHPDEISGWAHPPASSELVDHPRFLCSDCLARLEADDPDSYQTSLTSRPPASPEQLAQLETRTRSLPAGTELSPGQRHLLSTNAHLLPVEVLADGDLLVLDRTPAPNFPQGHFGPYILDLEGRLTDVNYHYGRYHQQPVPSATMHSAQAARHEAK